MNPKTPVYTRISRKLALASLAFLAALICYPTPALAQESLASICEDCSKTIKHGGPSALKICQTALSAARQAGDSTQSARIMVLIGQIGFRKMPKRTDQLFEQANAIYIELKDECGLKQVEMWLSYIHKQNDTPRSVERLWALMEQRSQDCLPLNDGRLELLMASCLGDLGKTDSALTMLNLGLPQAELNNKPLVPSILKSMGMQYIQSGNTEQGLRFVYKAAEQFKQQGNHYQLAIAYSLLSKIHGVYGSDSLSLLYGRQAGSHLLELKQSLASGGAFVEVAMTYENMGPAYTDSMRHYYQRALESYRSAPDLKTFNHFDFGQYCYAFWGLGQLDSAIHYMRRALQRAEERQVRNGLASMMGNLAMLYRQSGELDSSEKFALQSLANTDKEAFPEDRQIRLQTLSSIYRDKGDYAKAFSYLIQSFSLKDSLQRLRYDKLESMQNMGADHEIAQLTEQVEGLKQDLRDSKANENRQWLLGLAYLSVITLLLVGFLLLRRRHQNRMKQANAGFVQQQEAVAEQNRLLQEQLAQKKHELISLSLKLSNKSDVMNQLSEEVEDLKSNLPMVSKKLNSFIKLLKSHTDGQDEWESFRHNFEQVAPNFFKDLKTKHPELTQNERRLSALIAMNLGNAEIARIQNVQPDSVRRAKARLRQRLGFEQEEALQTMLEELK